MNGRTPNSTVVAWSANELRQIAEADDLHISPFREDGRTYGTPTWIWSVIVDGDLYVRGYNGRQSRWYQAAVRQRARRWSDQRSHRRGVPSEVRWQSVLTPDDQRTRALSDRARAAAKARVMRVRRGTGSSTTPRYFVAQPHMDSITGISSAPASLSW